MGRKRKPGNREPNGKPSRRIADKQAQRTLEEQDAMHVVKSARQRVHGVAVADSGTELAGSVCGRLFLQKLIERPQLDGAPAQPAPLDALDAFRAALAECGDLATIAEAYRNAGLGGTSAKDVGAVVRDRATALGCVCAYAWTCPEHGDAHVGGHD